MFFTTPDNGGVIKFDGMNWSKLEQIPGPTGSQAKGIAMNNHGRVWFVTGYGISSFDGETWTNFGEPEGLVGNYTYDVAVDRSDNVWVGYGSAGKGLLAIGGRYSLGLVNMSQGVSISSMGLESTEFKNATIIPFVSGFVVEPAIRGGGVIVPF